MLDQVVPTISLIRQPVTGSSTMSAYCFGLIALAVLTRVDTLVDVENATGGGAGHVGPDQYVERPLVGQSVPLGEGDEAPDLAQLRGYAARLHAGLVDPDLEARSGIQRDAFLRQPANEPQHRTLYASAVRGDFLDATNESTSASSSSFRAICRSLLSVNYNLTL